MCDQIIFNFGVATLEVDGLMMCIGYSTTGLITSQVGALLYGI
nr:hypothetical protein [Petrachloros mirabilis]